jgi:hypothetical protein
MGERRYIIPPMSNALTQIETLSQAVRSHSSFSESCSILSVGLWNEFSLVQRLFDRVMSIEDTFLDGDIPSPVSCPDIPQTNDDPTSETIAKDWIHVGLLFYKPYSPHP